MEIIMVSGISDSSYSVLYSAQTSSSSSELTEDEESTLDEILANYDSSDMSEDDFKSLMEDIKESGITMSKDLMSYMEKSGFEAPEAPPEMPEEDSEESSKIQELLEQLQNGEISQEDFDSIVQDMQKAGESTSGNLVDAKV